MADKKLPIIKSSSPKITILVRVAIKSNCSPEKPGAIIAENSLAKTKRIIAKNEKIKSPTRRSVEANL